MDKEGSHLDDKARNPIMAKEVNDILKQDPKNKVIYWAGSRHVQNDSKDPGYGASVPDALRKEHKQSVASVIMSGELGKGSDTMSDPLSHLTSDLKKPVSIDPSQAKKIGSMSHNNYKSEDYLKDYSQVLLFPRSKK